MHATKAPERLPIACQVREPASCAAQPRRAGTDSCHRSIVATVGPASCETKDAVARALGVHFAGFGILRRVVEGVCHPFFDVAGHVVDTIGGSPERKGSDR